MKTFPDDVSQFLHKNVDSIDQLEILRILGNDREKEWDAVALASEVQAEPKAVRAHLAALHARGLLAVTAQGAGAFYHFGARSRELEQLVHRLLQVYKERPVTTIKKVYEQAREPLRGIVDAFRIRKGD